MRHRISCCVFVIAAVSAFYGTVTAQSLNYSDAVTAPQVDSKMNNERGGIEKEIMVDALKGCRDGASCQNGAKYVTCAYTREIKTLGKPAHVVAGDKGLHYQLIIFNKNTGRPIASYGKTTWALTPVIGQGTMLMEKPDVKDGYNPIPKWCIESESISVLSPEGYVIGGKDCREYADRIKDDLIKNHGGKEISAPSFALLEVKTKRSLDISKTTIDEGQTEREPAREEHPETLSNTNIVSHLPMSDTNADVGVRGWCDCGDDHGKRYIVGDMFCMYDKLECDLAYTLCGRCGCVVRPKDCAGEGLQIMDVRLYKELKQKRGGKLSWSDAFDSLKARQSKIEAIPNGQIVVGGLCTCKVADPISVGFTNKITGEFFVCCTCGRVREPDEIGDIPNGPTALSEMGHHEQAEKEAERIRNWLEDGERSK